jgi:ATP-dependent Clp protease ATP-binding subunit ClpB
MTSNLGSHLIQESYDEIKEDETNENVIDSIHEKAKLKVMELLKQTIRPEFLNRIDEVVMFAPLSKRNLRGIVSIQLNQLKKLLLEKDIKLHITEESFDWICKTGYDPHFGARPVKRVIQKQVLNELSKAILSASLDTTKIVVMDVFDGKIVFRKAINEKEELVN